MVNGSKFYIFGGSRWREVHLDDGRVEGWGRARFVYPRRGRIQVAKTPAVLAALRDMVAGQHSALKDGTHLPNKKIEKIKVKEKTDHQLACDNSHCCHHSSNNGCNPTTTNKAADKVSTGTQCIPKADVGIQTSQTLIFPDTFSKQNSRKRHRASTSSDENLPTKITTTATVHINSPKKVPSLKLLKADSTKYNIYKRKRSISSDSVVWVVLPKNKVNEENASKTSKTLNPKSKPTTRRSIKNSDISGPKSMKVQTPDNITAKKVTDKQIGTQRSATSSDEPDIIQLSSSNFKPRTTLRRYKEVARKDLCKELIIDEEDIEILRNYLLNHSTDFDLLKFDQDDEYKKHFFFKINPLVNVDRCPKIARMLRSESQTEISLKDFASQLGLRSNSDKSLLPKRYRLRNRNTIDKDSELETDKENFELKSKGKGKLRKEDRSDFVKAKMSNRYTTESDLDSDLEAYRDKANRSDKLLREPNRRGHVKRYKTRNSQDRIYIESSDSNINYKSDFIKNNDNLTKKLNKTSQQNNVVQIFSPNRNKSRRSDVKSLMIHDSNSEVETRPGPHRRIRKVNNNRNSFNLTHTTSEDEFHLPKEKGKKKTDSSEETSEEDERELVRGPKKRIQNKPTHNRCLDLTKSSDESPVSPRIIRSRRKVKNIVHKAKHVDLTESNEENETGHPKPSREVNRRDGSKISNHKKHNLNHTSTTPEKESHKTKNAKSRNKVKSKGKNIDLTDEDTSESEEPKSLNDRRSQNTTSNKQNNMNGEDSDDNFEIVDSKSKDSNRGNKDTKKKLNHSNSDYKEETRKELNKGHKKDNNNTRKNIQSNTKSGSETPKELNRSNLNRINKAETEAKTPNEDNSETTKHSNENRKTKRRPGPNKMYDRKNVKERTADGDTSIETVKQTKEKNKEDSKSSKENRRGQINNNTTAETLDFSSDEREVFQEKRNALKVSQEGKSTAVTIQKPSSERSTSTIRPYSNLEDHAIVAWVSVGGRASCVNGNRIWRELQLEYHRIAGQARTWHSLRNRYLRYILPGLGALSLPATHAARLRAAAATGEIKTRKRSMADRRNSIFGVPQRGALSRRPGAKRSPSTELERPLPPKRHKHDHTKERRRDKSPSPKRMLRSSQASSPLATRLPLPPRHSPRYSDITRRFAATHQRDDSTPTVSPTLQLTQPAETPNNKLPARNSPGTKGRGPSQESTTRERRASKESLTQEGGVSVESSTKDRRASKESSATNQQNLRRSLRGKGAPASETAMSTDKSRTRTKLYNPGSIL